jgi:hypothetical protein
MIPYLVGLAFVALAASLLLEEKRPAKVDGPAEHPSKNALLPLLAAAAEEHERKQ